MAFLYLEQIDNIDNDIDTVDIAKCLQIIFVQIDNNFFIKLFNPDYVFVVFFPKFIGFLNIITES